MLSSSIKYKNKYIICLNIVSDKNAKLPLTPLLNTG